MDLPSFSIEPLILVSAFSAPVLLVLAVGVALAPRRSLERRLSGTPAPSPRHSGISLRDAMARVEAGRAAGTRQRLAAAGYASPRAPLVFGLVRLASAALLAAGFLAASAALGVDLAGNQRTALTLGLAGAGAILPSLLLDRRINARRRSMHEGFPDSLDLLQVCVEAGLGLDGALSRVGEEIGGAHPLLGEQYRLMTQELRAGRNRDDALRGLAERIGLDEAKALATLLIQSEALGSSIADALRAYAEDMRARRMLAAEERAQQLGVKLSMPLIVFILPALIVVIITPAAQKMARLFWPLIERVN